MSFTGHVQNGVVVFDSPIPLPEGTTVQVEEVQASGSDRKKSLLERLGDVVGKVEGLPPDASSNIDHYLYGREKE